MSPNQQTERDQDAAAANGETATGNGRVIFVATLIALAAASRLLPHPPNFSPIGALALFGGACFADRRLAWLMPLAALFASDLILGMHALVPVVYGSFALNVGLGRWLRSRRTVVATGAMTLIGAIQFFVITNFAHWLAYFPHNVAGLVTCYVDAIPFFRNALLGDFAYVTVLFGAMNLAESGFPQLRERVTQPVAA